MKVAAFYGKGDVRIEDRPIPTPGPNQLVVKINYVGVCGTDVEFYKGGYPPFVHLLMVLGHENVRSEERRVGKECRSRWSPYH